MVSRLTGIIGAVLLLILCTGIPAAAGQRVLTLAYDSNESWPWHLGTEGVPEAMPGLSIDYLRETARRLDVELRLVRTPFRRALALLKEGEIDGVFEASYRPERTEFGVYPLLPDGSPDADRSLFLQSYVFYVRRLDDRFQWDGTAMAGVPGMIGVLRNTSAAADLTAEGHPVFEVGDNVRALEMLAVGRLDVVLLLDNIGTAVFSRRPELAQALRTLSPPYEQKPYFLMFSHALVREDPAFAEAFWSELAAVARSDFAEDRLAEYEAALAEDRARAWGQDSPGIPTAPPQPPAEGQ